MYQAKCVNGDLDRDPDLVHLLRHMKCCLYLAKCVNGELDFMNGTVQPQPCHRPTRDAQAFAVQIPDPYIDARCNEQGQRRAASTCSVGSVPHADEQV
jgi:hypothetical protein